MAVMQFLTLPINIPCFWPRLLSINLFLQLKLIQIPASALYSRIQHIGDHIPHLVHLPVFLLVQYHEYHRTMTIISVLCDRRHANDYWSSSSIMFDEIYIAKTSHLNLGSGGSWSSCFTYCIWFLTFESVSIPNIYSILLSTPIWSNLQQSTVKSRPAKMEEATFSCVVCAKSFPPEKSQ